MPDSRLQRFTSLMVAATIAACGEGTITDSGGPGAPRDGFDSDEASEAPPSQPTQPSFGGGGQCSGTDDLDPIPPCDDSAYYVDAAQGSDSNSGAEASPWASLAHARQQAPSGATICVNSGNYGSFSESSGPGLAQRQVMRAAPGQTPSLSRISINYGSLQEADLTLSGFSVRASSGDVVAVVNTIGLRLNRLDVSAVKWAVNGTGVDGIRIENSHDTLVDNTKIHEIHRGMQVVDTKNVRILSNYIIATAGSGIQYLGGNVGGEIAYNHITGADWDKSDPDAIDKPHASIISFRSDDVILRGNHMHGLGSSSGIMFYQPDAAGGQASYDNILIENNAIYDISNVYAIRFYNLGSNVEIRNNLIFSGLKTDGSCGPYNTRNDARYRYKTAIIVHNRASGSPGLRLYNNIFVGVMSTSSIEDERNNYAWSWSGWVSTSPSGTSEIITSDHGGCGSHDPIFEDGSFFREQLDPRFPGRSVYDLRLAPDSPGWNFADPSFQPADSLGSIGPDGFVRPDGPCRSSTRHSVGPYEFNN